MTTPAPSSWAQFRAEPYRLLFPIAWCWGLVATWHWVALHLGWTHDYGLQYHGYLQTMGFGGGMAAGFLLTSLPFFLGASCASTAELALALLLSLLLGAGALLGNLDVTRAAFLLLNMFLLVFVGRRYNRQSGAPPPVTYVIVGLIHGVVGAACALLRPELFPRVGDRLMEQGVLLSYILGIGSFLGARFLGTFQPPAFLFRVRAGTRPVPPPVTMKKVFLLGGVLLFTSFWLEAGVSPLAGKALRAAVVSFQFFAFARIHRPPQPSLWSTQLLRASYWLVAAGLWLAALLPRYEVAAMHVTYLGGFGLMMLVIGLRVISNHGGVEAWWAGRHGLLAIVAIGAGLAVMLRVAANVWMIRYTLLLALGAAAWLTVLLAWGICLLPRVMPRHRPTGGEGS